MPVDQHNQFVSCSMVSCSWEWWTSVFRDRNGRFSEAERAQDAEFRCLASQSDVPRQIVVRQCRVAGGNVERQGESVQATRIWLHAVEYRPGWNIVVGSGSGHRSVWSSTSSLSARSHKQSESDERFLPVGAAPHDLSADRPVDQHCRPTMSVVILATNSIGRQGGLTPDINQKYSMA